MLITCQLPIHSDGEACYPKHLIVYSTFSSLLPYSYHLSETWSYSGQKAPLWWSLQELAQSFVEVSVCSTEIVCLKLVKLPAKNYLKCNKAHTRE